MNKTELLDRMKNARSWRELGMTIAEVMEVIDTNGVNTVSTTANDSAYKKQIAELEQENKQLKEKCDRLADANKQLRTENKELKGK